ncbi:unnamed protein product, partial [Rotaria sp. Silwood2]
RLPQGLKNSPSVFQRLMNQTLASLRWDVCLAYSDDIVVYSRSWDIRLVQKFIPRFAQISASLNKFTRKGFPFIWTEIEQASFNQLKDAITSPTVLVLPDPSEPYTIRTDASRVVQQTITPPISITPSTTATKTALSTSSVKAVSLFYDNDVLYQHQNQDSHIQAIKNTRPLPANYVIDDHNVLYKIVTRKFGQRINPRYLPASLTPNVLLTYHNSTFNGAHFGIKRTFYKIRDRCYWSNMYKDIEQHILSCLNCRKNKPSRRKPDGHLQSIEPPRGVWERLAMDYVGPVPQSKSGKKYFIVLTDLFSKFVVTKAVYDNTSTTAARFLLYDVFMIYGVPSEIITDNGHHFTSSLYKFLLKLADCCHVKTTPYNPQANGQCERHNATLVPNLVALSNHSRPHWDEKLLPTTFNYNATQHAFTS